MSDFRHIDHIRLAWLNLRRYQFDTAYREISEYILAYATAHGAAAKYHETITRAWAILVKNAIAANPDITDFDRFTEANPHLLNPKALEKYYSPDLLALQEARTRWLPPDRAVLTLYPQPAALALESLPGTLAIAPH